MKMQLFKVLSSLKVVKFDTKMYLNCSNFRGEPRLGGTSLGPKNGDKCQMGGIGKIFARKKTLPELLPTNLNFEIQRKKSTKKKKKKKQYHQLIFQNQLKSIDDSFVFFFHQFDLFSKVISQKKRKQVVL